MGNLTHTVSGDVASFRSAARVPIESLKCHFLPIQEGTGDPSPENVRPISGWQGITINKCKKNLFNFDINNVEYDVPNNNGENRSIYHTGIISDGRKISASAILIDTELTSNTQINLGYLQNGTLYQIISLIVWDTGAGYSRTVSIPIGQELLLVNATNSAYAWTRNMPRYNIQIEINDTNTIFEPYCDEQIPITFPIIGKNKFNWNVEFVNPDVTATTSTSKRIFQPYTYCVGGSYSNYFMPVAVENYNIENGVISVKRKTGYSVYGVSYALPLIGGQTYYLSCTAVSGFIHTAFYDQEGNYLTGSSGNYSNFSFTVPDNSTISVFNFIPSNTTDTATFSNIQIELGNIATEYIDFSNNNTVYGGYIDIAKGELVAEYEYMADTWGNWGTVNDMGDGTELRYKKFTNPVLGNTAGTNVAYCNVAPDQYANENGNIHFYIVGNSYNCRIYLPSGTDTNLQIQAIGKLITPIVYPLTTQQLKTFFNYNNIWSNANDITEALYQVHDSNMIQQAKKNMIAENQMHYKKVLWNQWAPTITADNWQPYNSSNVSITFNNEVSTSTWLDTKMGYTASMRTKVGIQQFDGQIWYVSYMLNASMANLDWGVEFCGGRQVTPVFKAPANTWIQCSWVAPYYRGERNYIYISNCKTSRLTQDHIGMTVQACAPIHVNLTEMFGKGNEPTKEEFEYLCKINNMDLTEYHSYDEGTEQIWCIPDHNKDQYITIEWNQYTKPINENNYALHTASAASATFENGVATRTITTETTSNNCYITAFRSNHTFPAVQGHIYYAKEELNSEVDKNYVISYGNNWHVKKIIPNQWSIIEDIFTHNSTGNKYIYLCYRSSASDIGETCSTRNPIFIDLTQMFGAGNEPTTPETLRAMCLKNNINLDEPQPYNTGTKMIWKI